MTTLVIGGAGFIGSALIKRLIKNNNNTDIVVVDKLSLGSIDNLRELNIVFYHEDINKVCNFLYGFHLKSYKFKNFKSSSHDKSSKQINLFSNKFKEIIVT